MFGIVFTAVTSI